MFLFSPKKIAKAKDFVDLHVHSYYSGDGEFSPDEIFRLAVSAGMCALAISDHDSVGAIPRALELARRQPVEFVPSVELTTECGEREIHLLGPYIQWNESTLSEALSVAAMRRKEQAHARIDALRQQGFVVTYEEAAAYVHDSPPSGLAIAAAVLGSWEKTRDSRLEPYLTGIRSDKPEIHFYRDHMGKGTRAHVHQRWMPTHEGIQIILACGGIPILAHPGARASRCNGRLISELKEAGLKGLEVFSSYHDEQASRYYHSLAARLELIPSAGSDFHGRFKPHVGFGSVRNLGWELISVLRSRRQLPALP